MPETYSFSSGSLARLSGVKEPLVRVVKRAITISGQDFTVQEGLRTLETQRAYMKRGVTRTMASKHLTGDAVDLVPIVEGTPRWEWPVIYPIALAMQTAAKVEGVALRWGGVWDRKLADLPHDVEGIKRAVAEYCVRHPGPDFLDGPHYELIS